MTNRIRRQLIKGTTAAAVVSATGPLFWTPSAYAQWNNAPEKGAKLRVLRWSRFVQGDIDTYMANVKKFTEKTGIEVRVDNEGWEDVRPKAAVAANTGAGPDIILSTNDDANLYPDKLLDVTDLCEYLGKKYGGWYASTESYLKPDGKKWIAVPLGCAGAMMVYRDSQLKAAGFNSFPKDTDGFLRMFKALKEKGTPGGMALGNATGDSGWTHWLVWAFGGSLVDKNNKVIIDSPETLKALEYAKELYPTFVPGTLSWLDPHNNKAFLDGQVSVTNNGISVYYAAKNSQDPKIKEMAGDIQHATFPIGPVGVPTEFHLFFNQMVMKYTKYPKAAKEFLRFMMEQDQFGPWLQGCGGYVSQPLKAYEANSIWTSDPKHTSASSIARKEFPDYDVTVRGAVSIGRRLMDPLSELVKIDPKSIGVGQYQHEVHQGQLKQSLDDVVVSSVNAVGVDLNTASSYLLTYVSGLGPNLADKIVEFRKENGPFTTREELKKVPRLGEKAFEQAAGFLRVRNGKQPLDDSAVHPESYGFVEQIALKNNLSISNLLANTSVLNQLQPSDFPLIDKFTFEDVITELKKQGRDPRGNAKVLEFDDRIKSIEDLKVGMRMNGIVTNVTAFGAFVNIGLKENGLIHKSNLAEHYVDDPSTVVALHDHVHVQVLEIDSARKRIGLKRLI